MTTETKPALYPDLPDPLCYLTFDGDGQFGTWTEAVQGQGTAVYAESVVRRLLADRESRVPSDDAIIELAHKHGLNRCEERERAALIPFARALLSRPSGEVVGTGAIDVHCAGPECSAINGIGHSVACQAEHDKTIDGLDTPGNRNPEHRYDGYKGRPLAGGSTADEAAAWTEGRNAAAPAAPVAPTEQAAIDAAWERIGDRMPSPDKYIGPVAPSVPEGWKLVPVEPTDGMLRAVERVKPAGAFIPGFTAEESEEYSRLYYRKERWSAIYRAMLAASPPSPAPKEPQS